MGACRGLVYCIGASLAATVTVAAAVGAAVMVTYVASVTVVAKMVGPSARWLVPLLIAGISLVDASVILVVSSSPVLALAAASGFGLTLFLQRWVPGD
jgi:hypothetical protein